MAYFYYLAPRDMVTLYASVTDVGAVTDAMHQATWLCDGRPNRPVKATSGTASWTVTCNPGNVNFVAAANTNLDAAETVSVSGGVTATLTSAVRGDQTRLNPWALVTPEVSNPTSIVVAVSGNSAAIRFGEFFAGKARELFYGTKPDADQEKEYRVLGAENWSSVPGYDIKQDRYRKSYEVVANVDQFEEIELWEQSTYRGTRPSVIVPDVDKNDCYVVKFVRFSYRKINQWWYDVTLDLLEYPRTQW
jgi:hypothetical protein